VCSVPRTIGAIELSELTGPRGDIFGMLVGELSGLRSLTGQSLSRAEKILSCINELSAREKIGPVNELLTSQSTCLFKRFAAYFR
jgi:hypothetical protein